MNSYKGKSKGVNSNKDIARIAMKDATLNSSTSKGKILTLPNVECKIERMILEMVSSKYTFLGVEREPDTYVKMFNYIKANNLILDIIPYLGNFSDLIFGKTENAYSHIIADYCGQLYPQSKELAYALQNKIVEIDGTISITLNERISTGKDKNKMALRFEKETIKGFGRRDKQYNRCQWQLICFIKKFGGKNFDIETIMPYSDTKKGNKAAKMMLFIVRRIK